MDTSCFSRGWRLATLSAVLLLGTSASALAFSPVAAAQSAPAPKAYVGLFSDNAVAVLDTSTNQILSTIPVPTGPHSADPLYRLFGLGMGLYFAAQGFGRLRWAVVANFTRLVIAVGGGWVALRITGDLTSVFMAVALGSPRSA
jgi:YVTN family beta-propeller protein